MFLPSLIVLLLTSSALASPYQFNGLTVTLSGPPSVVNSVDQLQFTATVTNHGTSDLKILKYSTILDDSLPTKSFNVTKGNMTVPFTGLKLFLSLPSLNNSSFTVIPAGQSIVVYHNVASLYNFSTLGTGNFTFQPVVNFQALPASQNYVAGVTALDSVNVISNNMLIAVTQNLVARQLQGFSKRAMDVCSVATQKAFVDSSYAEGKALASWATSYINTHGMDSLYTSYWGNTSTSNITSIYNAVALENSTTRTLSCTDSFSACSNGVVAYTLAATTNIYYCNLFFSQQPLNALCNGTTVFSRNIRGGTTLHEITHAVAGTDDISYGCAADQALPNQQALMNADNYNCFASQVYRNTQC